MNKFIAAAGYIDSWNIAHVSQTEIKKTNPRVKIYASIIEYTHLWIHMWHKFTNYHYWTVWTQEVILHLQIRYVFIRYVLEFHISSIPHPIAQERLHIALGCRISLACQQFRVINGNLRAAIRAASKSNSLIKRGRFGASIQNRLENLIKIWSNSNLISVNEG